MRHFTLIFAAVGAFGALVLGSPALDPRGVTPDLAGVLAQAKQAGLNLESFPWYADAVQELQGYISGAAATAAKVAATKTPCPGSRCDSNGQAIDVHSHLVFQWYQKMVPVTGQNPTPSWSPEAHLEFNRANGIRHTIIANSAPGADVTAGDQASTIAIARMLNIGCWVITKLYPSTFSYFAVVPLPYTAAAIAEATYTLDHLGAVGLVTLTNHNGLYLGNHQFTPFFKYLNERNGRKEERTVIFIHPGTPWLKVGDALVEANPTLYSTGLVEFYFETARCLMDLTYTQTIQNYTKVDYISAHVGGAFPSILDRALKSAPQLELAAKHAYKTRFYWDSAGPTYYDQVKGLLGYGVPTSQLLFGTDFPYAPAFTFGPSTEAVKNATFISSADKEKIFTTNAKKLFAGKIKW